MQDKIPADVRRSVEEIVARFNSTEAPGPEYYYTPRYRGVYLYLGRSDGDRVVPVCRLTYTGDMDAWEFAIYKYSDGQYDAEEWFPGMECIDGTIEGAMMAGLRAYPD